MGFSIYLFLLIIFLCLWLIPQSQMSSKSAYCEFDDTDHAGYDFHQFMSGELFDDDGSEPFG